MSHATENSSSQPTKEACSNYCSTKGGRYTYGNDPVSKGEEGMPFVVKSTGLGNELKAKGADIVIWLLEALLAFVGWILNVAVLLFAKIIDPNVTSLIINNSAIEETWQLVRDLCNLGFIFILLFSAFATIFQASKYNYKNILLWVVIMALLVNFSYPISRFIIDFFNSLMYSILNIEFSGYVDDGGKIFTTTPAFGDLKDIITPENPTIEQLIASIIFVFILALTILALAIILTIRTMALAIIVIFSPLGFIGKVINKDAGWWNYLFKYAMAGPIIAITLLISTRLMEATGSMAISPTGSTYGESDVPIIVRIADFIIPIVILWMGIGMAVKGIDGSGAIMSKMQSFAKKTGRNIGGLRPAASWLSKKSGVTGAAQQRWAQFKREGKWLGSDAVAGREARRAGQFGVKGAVEDFERGKISEIRKKWKDNGGATDTDITAGLRDGGLKAKAAAMEAAEKVGFGDKDHENENYQRALRALSGKNDAKLRSIFNDKVKEKNIHLAINDAISNGTSPEDAYKNNLLGMTPDELAKQRGLHQNAADPNFKDYILKEVAVDPEYHKELFKKMNREGRKAYIAENLNPEAIGKSVNNPQGSATETKRSHEEVQKERARKADDEMKKYFKPGEFS